MSLTQSLMMPLGTTAPNFSLTDTVSGKTYTINDLKSPTATVIMFICNHCPFVKHIQHELIKLAEDYIVHGVNFAAISANDIKDYPEDSPQKMRDVAQSLGYPFPYLYDETQKVAKAYMAACTPDFYIFDKDLRCVYRGQLDGSRPGNGIPVTGKDLRAALDNILAGHEVDVNQIPSQGCNIKWKGDLL